MEDIKIKKICVITEEYPIDDRPRFPFVDQLICQFADLGLEIVVLNPVSITRKIIYKENLKPKTWEKTTRNGAKVTIVCPRYFSFSSKKIGRINTSVFTLNSFIKACLKWFRKNGVDFDVVYGHFIFPSGITANIIGKKYSVPAFLAYGENTTYTIDYLGEGQTGKLLDNIRGVISVSTKNKEILLQHHLFKDDQIEVFPNGIDKALFYPRDKAEMRKKYGLPETDFIVIFVGGFIQIKGANRLADAISSLNDASIKSVFIGSGNVVPKCGGILLQRPMPHNQIPEILSAADIFALPTLAEGCCNAIIEAMACGLPIISSKYSFNDDILDQTCSIRVDPENIGEIANAIGLLHTDRDLRNRLALGALKKANDFNVENRARGIINFIKKRL